MVRFELNAAVQINGIVAMSICRIKIFGRKMMNDTIAASAYVIHSAGDAEAWIGDGQIGRTDRTGHSEEDERSALYSEKM